MKVFNITDAPTSALETRGLVNQHIKVGDTVIPRGGSATLRGTARERSELHVFVKVGAVTVDELPPAYAARRGLNVDGSPIAKKAPEPIIVHTPSPKMVPGPDPVDEFMDSMALPPEEPEPPKKGRR